jgi:hypothetical protein
MSTEYDFGFSFEDSEPTSTPIPQENSDLKALQEKVDTLLNSQAQLLEDKVLSMEDKYKAKLKDVENLILPLLYNLMKNPDKAYIKWENRAPVIQKQIDKITAITRS